MQDTAGTLYRTAHEEREARKKTFIEACREWMQAVREEANFFRLEWTWNTYVDARNDYLGFPPRII